MSVIQSIQNLANTASISRGTGTGSGLKPYQFVDVAQRNDLLRAQNRLLRLYRALESVAQVADVKTQFRFDITDARSATALGLDLTHTAATLTSSSEINASPMSFTPFGPDWSDGSDALITIGGEYDGSHGTGPLTFEVRRAGTRGVDDLRIRVEDPEGNRIRNINIRDHHALDRQYSLQNGLYLTLGAGSLIDRDTTSIQVFDNVGAVVDPDNPLGGIRNQNPNLQFGMPAIVDGSFQLNGTNINVSTTDSLNDVVNRINQSGAGVTAAFNSATEAIDFVQDTLGSAPTIDLQGDTSNFLQATRLDSSNTAPGIDPETIQALDNVGAFAGVQSGEILLNDERIAIDTSNDSLLTIIDRINASDAGVVASFDPASQEVAIRSGDNVGRLDIDSNDTGLFAALNIAEGQYARRVVGNGIGKRISYEVADKLEAVFSDLNYLFRDASFAGNGEHVAPFRSALESAIRTALGGELSNEIDGLAFNGSSDARRRGGFAEIDRREFTVSLQRDGASLMDLLRGTNGEAGLIERLMVGTQQALRGIGFQLGQSGSFINTFA